MGKPFLTGTLPLPSIAVDVGQRRYNDIDGNYVVVSVSSNSKVLPSLSVFQYAVAFSEPLAALRFVLGMPLSCHAFIIGSGQRVLQTECSAWLRCWIHFGGRGAAWLLTFGIETDMPLFFMSEDVRYERRRTCML